MDGRRLDDIGILLEPYAPPINRHRRSVVRSHILRSYMNRRRRGEQGPIRIFLYIAVGTLHIAIGQGVAVGAIDANRIGSGCHTSIGYARATDKNKHLIRGSVSRRVCPSLHSFVGSQIVGIREMTGLNDGLDATLWKERGIDRVAGANAVGLA